MNKFRDFTNALKDIKSKTLTDDQINKINKILIDAEMDRKDPLGKVKVNRANIVKLEALMLCSARLADICNYLVDCSVSELSECTSEMKERLEEYRTVLFHLKLDKDK